MQTTRRKNGGSVGVIEIRRILADQFDCCHCQSCKYALLDRLNLVWITGRYRRPKSSDEAIELYKELFPGEVENTKSFIDAEKNEIWWQDVLELFFLIEMLAVR